MEEDHVLGGKKKIMIFRHVELELPKNEIFRKQLTPVANRKIWARGTDLGAICYLKDT